MSTAVSAKMLGWYTQQLENHCGAEMQDPLMAIVRHNALKIFPRLRERISIFNHLE